MKWLSAGLLLALLSGCVVKQPQFSVPDKVNFKGTTFERVTHNQIDEMQQMLYLPAQGTKNPDDWQQGILVFLDQNSQGKTLQQRAELRQQSYQKQQETQAKVAIMGNELQSQVIYPPTERFHDVLLEVSRGRDLTCGFGQMQFADKRVDQSRILRLSTYQHQLSQLALEFSQLPWQIECK